MQLHNRGLLQQLMNKSQTSSSMTGSSVSPSQALPKNGVDTVLAAFGKKLRPGQSVSFQLIKSHKALFQQVDPVNAKKAPPSDFPLVAKFPESVVRPDLTRSPWLTGRFYEQDYQTIVDEDDEDETAALEQKQRKRKRWGSSKDSTQRQWVLQEETEFAETMLARKERKVAPNHQGSSRYEATAEHNPSYYLMLELVPNRSSNGNPVFQVTVLPTPYAMHTFSQPMARNALSLTQAEQLLSEQRSQTMTRFMMHSSLNTSSINNNNGINQHRVVLPFSGLTAMRNPNSSKARLLGKLKQQHAISGTPDDEDDDVMGDIAFRNRRKGGGSRARKELITSMADESVRVDDEGVLGGSNDAEFGGKRHFGRVHIPTAAGAATTDGAAAASSAGAATGAESMAMSNDFYQRDVQAEYDELDYDANEQFDDDDVDVGETEVVVDSRGFGGADDDDENDPDADDDDDEDEADHDVSSGGAEGLASLAGFRAMLAKARDRTTSPTTVAANATASGNAADATGSSGAATSGAADDAKVDGNKGGAADDGSPTDASTNDITNGGVASDAAILPEGKKKKKDQGATASSSSPQQGDDELAQLMAAAEKSAAAAKQKASPDKGGAAAGAGKFTGLEVDDAGQRLVTLEAIRHEIWLNHGSIAMKRLMKIFNIKKRSSAERQESFKSLIRELCTMEEDPVNGRKLVLKQHYANMR